jgi:CubicO group peptidase (beta-lactamase class C family)
VAVDTTVRFLGDATDWQAVEKSPSMVFQQPASRFIFEVARIRGPPTGTAATEEPSRMTVSSHRVRHLAAALVFVGSLASCVSPQGQRANGDTPGLDAIVDEVIVRYHLPGIAVGVVRDGRVIYTRTAGETVAGSKQAVDADTLFKIASNSKAMTAAVLARLVDRGQLRWEDPVTRHLHTFRMSDDWITREIQVRDLLIHNSGLREGAGDLMLWPEPNAYTRADILAGLAHLKPQQSFRTQYAYDNLLYVVAGEVAAAAGGMPYEALVQREVFTPLGMTRCHAGAFDRDVVGNVAQPHMRSGDGNIVIRADPVSVPVSTSAAAGGIRCSLNDMLTWVRVWLDPQLRGRDGLPWLSAERRKDLWGAHMPMPISARQRGWEGTRFLAYGYGWRISDADGRWRVAHTGTLAGMYSAVTLLPEMNVGFVFMINGEGSTARQILNRMLVAHFTQPASKPTVAALAAELASAAGEPATAPQLAPRTPARPAAVSQWLGLYRDPWFGDLRVCASSDTVDVRAAKSPLLSGTLQQNGERLSVDWSDPSVDVDAWLDFSHGAHGVELHMAKVDPDADFSFDYEDLAFTRIGHCP